LSAVLARAVVRPKSGASEIHGKEARTGGVTECCLPVD
jgi:hypothetical protein